jgi:hypothetical protein
MAINIACDSCGFDLTSAHSVTWRIQLCLDTVPYASGPTMDIHVEPPFTPGSYAFCSVNCLTSFLASQPTKS